MSSFRYRPHVDGLRSIAIIPVVLYHAEVPFLSGGFVGVDIFFVISGYLITGILFRELEEKRFSIAGFYRRRILRIVPLLTAVLLAVLVAGWFVMFPFELRALGETTEAAALFVSNIYFYVTTDYFDSPADSVPLLHTWSLAVEEQFYIFFPILLYVLHRWARKQLFWVLVALVAGSFILSCFGTQIARIATFYLLPTRAWELGAGGLLAVAGTTRFDSRRLREVLSWIGLVLVVAPIFYLNGESSFPGANALPPVLGATIIIGLAEETTVGRILSWGPLVYVGLISYALYLWHWPVLVFDKFIAGPDMDMLAIVRVVGISLLLAALSRPLIEQPFRQRLGSRRTPAILTGGVAALVVVAAIGFALQQSWVATRSYPQGVIALADYATYPKTEAYRQQFRSGTCFIENDKASITAFNRDTCLALSPDKPNILLMGDSHAAHLWAGLQTDYPQYNILQASFVGCRPLLHATGLKACTGLMSSIFNDFITSHHLDGVILAGRWQDYEVADIADTATYVARHVPHVMVLGPTVEYGGAAPTILARAAIWNPGSDVLTRARSAQRTALDGVLQAKIAETPATYRSLIAIECPGGTCRELAAPGVPMQFDYGHLTAAGSRIVAAHLLDGWITGKN